MVRFPSDRGDQHGGHKRNTANPQDDPEDVNGSRDHKMVIVHLSALLLTVYYTAMAVYIWPYIS